MDRLLKGRQMKKIPSAAWCHSWEAFLLQKSMPLVVFKEPIKRYEGKQMQAVTIPKLTKFAFGSILVIPNIDYPAALASAFSQQGPQIGLERRSLVSGLTVTKVNGRKNIDT